MDDRHPVDRRTFFKTAGLGTFGLMALGADRRAEASSELPAAIHGALEAGVLKRTLGRTGLKVTAIGLGTIPTFRAPQAQAVKVIRKSIDLGINYIDTARAYRKGYSEERIGEALKGIRQNVVIATKTRTFDSGEGALKDVETSLKELGLEKIDLYQCHFVKDFDAYRRVTSPGGALPGLLKARDEGLIGHVGITSHSLDVLERAIDDGHFETIMNCYSFLEPKAEEKVIPKAIASDIGVIVMKAFSGGVIENARLALKYNLARGGTVIIPGVESKDIFDENWEIFRGHWTLSGEERQQIGAMRSEFDRQFCRRCDYCQPCPENIPIQTMMGVKYMVKRMGLEALGGPWIKNSVAAARNCTGCGACLERCPYELPIPDLIRENLAWVEELMSQGR